MYRVIETVKGYEPVEWENTVDSVYEYIDAINGKYPKCVIGFKHSKNKNHINIVVNNKIETNLLFIK